MTDNAKKFLEKVSKDAALKSALEAEVQKAQNEAIVKFASAHGTTLTAEDFKPAKMEALSENELKAVAGGGSCICPVAGVGMGDGLDCSCTLTGSGGNQNCLCVGAGTGSK